ncbi:hypothetical protein A1O3_05548 [Capronia epimyces CBS 606.96]|uniref:Uncharacterized protein n=1 Tax=Capronia epimyces CBS 606.96 TaxID=1182542 RepID=W9XXD4_9EURO|nr:uncharacterized protein A1O3_05548 [Capronia epimyces CBS 606.96]EXJ84873.1 hypothetical protein A1O3_05548 [Capronia epimyces CBS 606.96]
MALLERCPLPPYILCPRTTADRRYSLKPFWPLLFTFVLPRAINYYRIVKTTIRTRPLPRALPEKTSRGLNVLFASICVFLYASLPSFKGDLTKHNIFVVTQSRLSAATDTLFARLALFREHGVLTATDDALRSKLGSQALRQSYLRFGPQTLLDCTFCHPDDDFSFLLYYLPTNVLLSHLFHILCLGLATSEPIAGFEASRWRTRALLGGIALAGLDFAIASMYAPIVDQGTPAPAGTFWIAATLRPLALCVFDAIVAFLIYASTTHRFLLFNPDSATDPELTRRRTEELLITANIALQMTQTNLRAYSIARNAVVRSPQLKAADDEYWRRVVAMEGIDGDESLFEDEEVQAAVSRAYGRGAVNVAAMRKDAEMFVQHATRGLNPSETGATTS